MLLYMNYIFSSLQGHLHFCVHFFFAFTGAFFLVHPIYERVHFMLIQPTVQWLCNDVVYATIVSINLLNRNECIDILLCIDNCYVLLLRFPSGDAAENEWRRRAGERFERDSMRFCRWFGFTHFSHGKRRHFRVGKRLGRPRSGHRGNEWWRVVVVGLDGVMWWRAPCLVEQRAKLRMQIGNAIDL